MFKINQIIGNWLQKPRVHCWACGQNAKLERHYIITPEIAIGCGFSPAMAEAYDVREGLSCKACGASRRSWHVAKTLVELYGSQQCRSLSKLCDEGPFRSLKIAEINQCGHLHKYLKTLPYLYYSEFGSTDINVPSENALSLSYLDADFDLVLTSDTLEHVPDFEKTLSEIRRILKPDGRHIFTIPVVWDRHETRRRAIIEDGKIIHILLPPCYHGGSVNPEDCLAFYEFGTEVMATVRNAGFELEVVHDVARPAVRTFVSTKM